MRKSDAILAEERFVEKQLGASRICETCTATLENYASKCTAELSEICEGFLAIENARKAFQTARKK